MSLWLLDSTVVTSDNPIALAPEWDFREETVQQRRDHRTLGGLLYQHRWRPFKAFTVPLRYVGSADASRINDWWRADHTVALTLGTSASPLVYYCKIVNAELPFGVLEQPYSDLYQGALLLEATVTGSAQAHPFILDDAVWGLLDQTYNELV